MAIVHRIPPKYSHNQMHILQPKNQPLQSSLRIPNRLMSWGSGKSHLFINPLYLHLILQEYDDTPIIGERLDTLCDLADQVYGEYQTCKMLLECGALGSSLKAQQQKMHKIEGSGLMLLDLMKETSGL